MGFLSSLFSSGNAQTQDVVIDLGNFVCGHTKLGSVPDARDFFTKSFRTADVYQSVRDGFEVGTKEGKLHYVFITCATYKGGFVNSGSSIALNPTTTPDHIITAFGEPYWIDSKDGETILFYEFEGGTVELQFEFPNNKNLGCVTLARNGVLSDAKQRRFYGVTKSWPPSKS